VREEEELDPVSIAGTVTIQGDRMAFTLMHRQGDDYAFECRRRT
jgi:hypothetical protein